MQRALATVSSRPLEGALRAGRALTLTLAAGTLTAASAPPAFALDGPQFESPSIHPVELSFDGDRLFALHQADHRLIIFDLTVDPPARLAEIFVGLEPVSVRQRTEDEVWVVNHLSDTVAIVDLESGQIVRTLLVGDEPTDVVFAGHPARAFVCLSQENRLVVFDPQDLDAAPTRIDLTMEEPVALGVSPDGGTVYVVSMDSGNLTSIVDHDDVAVGGGPPPPNPPMRPDLPDPPLTGLIVKHDGGAWRDEIGRSWNAYVPYTLVDHDVLALDTGNYTDVEIYRGVGTTLFGIGVNPFDGRLYVSNQEAFNEVRFEPNVSGRFLHNRVTVIDPGSATVTPRHLNEHIDYSQPGGSPGERAASLSIPTAVAVSTDGTVYVAAFGSAKIGVLDGNAALLRRIEVGDGPLGLALDEARQRLYVLRRIPGALDVVDLTDDSVLSLGLGFDPTPAEIHTGRRRFYDGESSSAHGDLSCASCHVFGRTDHLAWDLGNPEGDVEFSPAGNEFHPMKGPLMTQTLLGLPETEPFHWRGDRPELSSFNGAFVSLLGRGSELSNVEFDEMASFISALAYPPNPNRNLDGSLHDPMGGPSATKGEYLFTSGGLFGGIECTGCHTPPHGQNGVIIPKTIFDGEQDLDVPQLRNLYEKTGFDEHATQNVRGFGFTHDGAMGSIIEFLQAPRFTFARPGDREHVNEFLLSFDTGTHAAVGAQWTTDGTLSPTGRERLDVLVAVAQQGPLGVVAKGRDHAGDARGWVLAPNGLWNPDRAQEQGLTTDALLALATPGRELTFTGVFPGTEHRLGIDRDLDGHLDRDELDQGSDPGDPEDPGTAPEPSDLSAEGVNASRLHLEPIAPNPAVARARLAFTISEGLAREDSGNAVEDARAQATLAVYDVGGRRVRSFVLEAAPGRHELYWDLTDALGSPVAAGLYFARLHVGEESRTQRVVVRR